MTDDETYLGIYSTNIATDYAVPTLMHDHTYRMAVAWQNTAYNQPPHLGYNLAEATKVRFVNLEKEFQTTVDQEVTIVAKTRYAKSVSLVRSYLPDGTSKIGAATGFTRTIDNTLKTITITGAPQQEGDYRFAIRATGMDGEQLNDTIVLHVSAATGIEQMPAAISHETAVFDLSGHQLPEKSVAHLPKGVYLVRQRTANGWVTRKIIK